MSRLSRSWTYSAWVVSALFAAAIFGCSHNTRQAIIYAPSADPNVKNGTAFDRGTLPLDGVNTCVVPAEAKVEHRDDAIELVILLEKAMHYMGHPPKRHTINLARADMGVAFRRDGEKLMIVEYGESSTSEGGNRVQLRIIAPAGLIVERLDPSLELPPDYGPGALARSPLRLRTSDDARWCELEGSPDRWTIVETSPDVESMQEAVLAGKSQNDK